MSRKSDTPERVASLLPLPEIASDTYSNFAPSTRVDTADDILQFTKCVTYTYKYL